MFSHIMLGANDLEVSKDFYDATLATLGIRAGVFSHDKTIA
jgi:catechol 2,3-dioxygenase-like lactoylglutathione lyase family enzyme